MIISISRRCDIPRFAFDWFLEKLDAGFVDVKNPFNPRQIKRISLLPPALERKPEECAEVLAFWTRDPVFILEHAEKLEDQGYRFFVMTTLTSYPAILEPNVPPAETVIQTLKKLAQKITADRIIWRYDPVFLSDLTDHEFHLRNFAYLAARLKGTVKRVIVSVYDEYSTAEKRLAALEQSGKLKRLAHYEKRDGQGPVLNSAAKQLLIEIARIARTEGMEIQSCAEEDIADCSQPENCLQSGSRGIRPGACIDGILIEKLFNLNPPGRDRGQKRPRCLCAESVDIGSYGACPAGCVYCYARH